MLRLIVLLIILLNFSNAFAQTEGNNQPDWFPFTPESNVKEGVIGMSDWLDAPAGKHGFVKNEGEKLIFENGTPVLFWGTNICNNRLFIESEKVDSFVNFLGKYGVNAVRFHKFTWHAYDGDRSTDLAPDKYARLDYFQSQLKKKGIYFGWSHIYGQKVLPADSARLVAYSEIRNLHYPWSYLDGTTSGLVNFAPDLQDLSIELTVNMLNHVNPETGLRYADDPALAYIEFQNEDDIFWGAIEYSLKQAPIYKAMFCKQFSHWLKMKYGNQQKLEKAWGKENIPEGQTLEKENICPRANHNFFSQKYKISLEENRTEDRYLLDMMRFLYETQMAFYKKFEKAIRATGYKGMLVGSCWQAGSGPSHFYNLHADYEVGMIDRHNYFGPREHRITEGPVANSSMLTTPGTGLLGTGLQQVADRPFSFSEWMSKVPNEWTAEAVPLVGIYGMGLQGWDASFSFAVDVPRFSKCIQADYGGLYNATSPLHMGLYPAIARMIYRNDIQEARIMATQNVNIDALEDGKLGVETFVKQGFDDKSFSGTISSDLLAVGRFPVRFTDSYEATLIPDLSVYRDTTAKTIVSETGELRWQYGKNPYVTVNTASTKGLIGFAPNKKIELSDWTIETENPFAVILITNLSQQGNLQSTDKILVTAIARARNTGMEYVHDGEQTLLKNRGKAPLLLEPVKFSISFKYSNQYSIKALDQDGELINSTLPIQNGSVRINTGKYKTMYYLITKK